MGMGVTIEINGDRIGTLTCTRVRGDPAGWCRYWCEYHDAQAPTGFEVFHYRPSGAPALVAAAMTRLAEAGIGRQEVGDGTVDERASEQIQRRPKRPRQGGADGGWDHLRVPGGGAAV